MREKSLGGISAPPRLCERLVSDPMADDIPVAQIESLALDGRRLRVEFLQVGDRYAHRLVAIDANGSESILLRSIELTTDDASLEYPALQSLHVQPLGDREGSLAALVGMSGANHWSLSVEPDPAAPSPRLVFDAACRIKRNGLMRTASRYARVAEATPAEGIRIEPLPTVGQSAAPSLETGVDAIGIVREITPADVAPTTVRWRYAIELIG
jgi:hypothetical protein